MESYLNSQELELKVLVISMFCKISCLLHDFEL